MHAFINHIIYTLFISLLLLMASQISLLSSILLLILFFHGLSVLDPTCRASTSIPKQTGFRATVTRANLPKNRRVLNEFTLLGLDVLLSTLNSNGDEYTMDLNIGTPPVAFHAVIDTGSDLIWAKCNTNNSSSSSSFFSTTKTTNFSSISSSSPVGIGYSSLYRDIYKYYYSSSSSPPLNTSLLLFDPLKSQSFSKVTEPCTSFGLHEDCKQSYADNTVISFYMGNDTLTMDPTPMLGTIQDVTLACGVPEGDGFKYDGVLGMGRGTVSLLSQLKERVFAYCLPWRFGGQSKTGLFTTGFGARSLGNKMTQTMPLLSNSKPGCESFYYVSLEGISVGETRLDVTRSDFALLTDGTGGMIVDSGKTFTSLEDRIVGMIKDEFLRQTGLEKSEAYKAPYDVLDLCFNSNDVVSFVLPTIVFHFEGADWELPRENYMYEDGSHPQACFAIVAASPNDTMSVLGNMQQQDIIMVFDLDKNSLSFKPENCNNS